MVHMPRETNDYDTVYLLRQFNVQPIKSDPRVRVRPKENTLPQRGKMRDDTDALRQRCECHDTTIDTNARVLDARELQASELHTAER